MRRKEWQLSTKTPRQGTVLDRVLAARGIADETSRRLFFHGSLGDLHDPLQLPDMDVALKLLWQVKEAQGTVLIHGDYDVDGLTSSALMLRVLERLGLPCRAIVPDRVTEGYGLSPSSLEKILQSDCRLLLTVDCGISDHEAIARVREAGIHVIVTDHHECPATLPPADAVINPKRPDSRYPFRELAGVGVAAKLVQALCRQWGKPDCLQEHADWIALGTVADIVPLVDENRILARVGMAAMQQRPSPGIAALIEISGAGDSLDERTLGYALAPRINAAGRLGQAHLALELLLENDAARARQLAAKLDALNRERQAIEAQVTEEAAASLESCRDWGEASVLVATADHWHVGVLGIAASRLANRYERPVIVLTRSEDAYQGSGRSHGSFNLHAALTEHADLLAQFGGHPKAAGLTVAASSLEPFRQAMARHRQGDGTLSRQVIVADMELPLAQISDKLARQLMTLAPFGEGNPKPIFLLRDLSLRQVQLTQDGRHLRLSLADDTGQRSLPGIAFGLGDLAPCLSPHRPVDLLATPQLNAWRGRKTLQLEIADIGPSRSGDVLQDRPWELERRYRQDADLDALQAAFSVPGENLIPRQEEYGVVYHFLQRILSAKGKLLDLSMLTLRINNQTRLDLNMFRLARILSVFQETGLVQLQRLGSDRVCLSMQPVDGKVDLKKAPSYRRMHQTKEDA